MPPCDTHSPLRIFVSCMSNLRLLIAPKFVSDLTLGDLSWPRLWQSNGRETDRLGSFVVRDLAAAVGNDFLGGDSLLIARDDDGVNRSTPFFARYADPRAFKNVVPDCIRRCFWLSPLFGTHRSFQGARRKHAAESASYWRRLACARARCQPLTSLRYSPPLEALL